MNNVKESKVRPVVRGFSASPFHRSALERRYERAPISNDTPSYARDESREIARMARVNRYGR